MSEPPGRLGEPVGGEPGPLVVGDPVPVPVEGGIGSARTTDTFDVAGPTGAGGATGFATGGTTGTWTDFVTK